MATDWLRYSNQSATRRLPLNDRLIQALGFLPEIGVSMEVFSGGQPGKGSGLARIGSTRHDHGNAADVFFLKDGRRLDWGNKADQPIFEEIVRRGKDAGITGFGAGPGYMQRGSMHLGFGSPGVWGAGGKGENAPDWLRSAYAGGVAPLTGTVAGSGPQPATTVPAGRPSFGSIAASMPSASAPIVPSPAAPPAVQAAAAPAEKASSPLSNIFGMMAMSGDSGPQFQPAQIMGPSAEQSTGLLQLVQALKNRVA